MFFFLKNSIPLYGNQPNTDKVAKRFFASHFNQVFNKSKINTNDGRRGLFVHFTSVVDSKTTKSVIADGELFNYFFVSNHYFFSFFSFFVV
jgi:hypothetical protein